MSLLREQIDEIQKVASALRGIRDLLLPDGNEMEFVSREDLTNLLEVVIERLETNLERVEGSFSKA